MKVEPGTIVENITTGILYEVTRLNKSYVYVKRVRGEEKVISSALKRRRGIKPFKMLRKDFEQQFKGD